MQRDPLVIGRKRLEELGRWTDAQDKQVHGDAADKIAGAIAEAEALPEPGAETLFEDLYADAPWIVAEQREALVAELSAAARVRPGQT